MSGRPTARGTGMRSSKVHSLSSGPHDPKLDLNKMVTRVGARHRAAMLSGPFCLAVFMGMAFAAAGTDPPVTLNVRIIGFEEIDSVLCPRTSPSIPVRRSSGSTG